MFFILLLTAIFFGLIMIVFLCFNNIAKKMYKDKKIEEEEAKENAVYVGRRTRRAPAKDKIE